MSLTYGKLSREAGRWTITDLEPHVRIKLKAIFTSIARTDIGPYGFAATPQVAADLAWFISRYPLEASATDLDVLAASVRTFEAQQATVTQVWSGRAPLRDWAGLRPGQTVRGHQARNVELLALTGGLLVADDVGKGKTYTAGAACLLPGALPATIVCPPHLARQWKKKLEEFTTLSVHVVTSTRPYPLPPVDVRIFGFTQLAGWIDVLELLGTGLAAFDEGHELRRGAYETQKGQAAARLVQTSRLKLMLTATPVFNYGDEIWNLLSFYRPDVLGDRPDFIREWCQVGAQVKDPVALGSYLREQHAMVREFGGEPKANRIVEVIPHDVDRLASVEAAMRALAHTVRHGGFHASGEAARQMDMRLRQETGVAKAPFVASFVRAFIEATDEPVMLFGWHREVYDIWQAALSDLGVVMYTGTESPAAKARSVEAFRAGEAKVFVISLRSGAGLDGLQHCCSTVIFGELDWSPAMHEQCIGRLNREGQKVWADSGLVDAIFLVADDGSDPPIMDVLGIKSGQADGVTDLGTGLGARVEDRKPIERLIARYLDAADLVGMGLVSAGGGA